MSSAFSPVAKLSFAHDSTAPGEASSNLPPRPQHFITRTDGSITPLIAVDELPESMRIVGVPAIISQAATLNMMNLGVQARSQTKYIVEMPEESGSGNTSHLSQRSTTTGGNFQSPGKRVARLKTIKTEERKTAAGVHEVEEWRLGVNSIDEAQAAIDAVVAAHAKSEAIHSPRTPKALTPGVFGEKKYCTHWIRWGECDYMQQGCKYRHEMPDEETLVAIGIRSIPKWYKDANAPKSGWVEEALPSDRVWREPSSRAIQQISPYRLPYLSGVEFFRPPYIPSDEAFRPPFQSSAERLHHSRRPLGPMPGARPTFPNGFAPLPGSFSQSANVPMRTIRHFQYTPPQPKFLGSKIKSGGPSSRLPVTASSSVHRTKLASTKRLVPASINTAASPSTATSSGAAAAAVVPPHSAPIGSGAPTSPFSPPLTSQPLSPAGVLPTSLAPTPRSLFPFLPPPEPVTLPATPVPEIKTPAPRHRRLFVAAGESAFVENGTSEKTEGTSEMGDGGKWEQLGKGIEELLVDFEE